MRLRTRPGVFRPRSNSRLRDGFAVEIVHAQRGPLGPLMTARGQALRWDGRLPSGSDQADEEILVFSGRLALEPELTREPESSQPTLAPVTSVSAR